MKLGAEERCGYVISAKMKEVWSIQLDLVKKLLGVCSRNNLRIWADAGTLLGAVRHNGYIPWDDDIDFVMMREDYDKLLALSSSFENPYFLQSAINEDGYLRGHAQLRNINTAAILPGEIWLPYNQGIFIDIFVLDNIPDNKNMWKSKVEAIGLAMSRMKERIYTPIISRYPRSVIKQLKSILYYDAHSMRAEYEKLEDIARGMPLGSEQGVTYYLFRQDVDNIIVRHKEWYDKTIWLDYENITIPAPEKYDEVLKCLYGADYMTLRQAPTMHGTVIFDTERPYTEVLKELRAKATWKERLRGRSIIPYREKK